MTCEGCRIKIRRASGQRRVRPRATSFLINLILRPLSGLLPSPPGEASDPGRRIRRETSRSTHFSTLQAKRLGIDFC